MLWLALDFPLLPLEALLRGHASFRSPVEPWTVADARCVLACNEAAERAGVRPGMGLAVAHALVSGLRVGARNPAVEREALEAVATWLCQFTPSVSLEPPRSMLAEIEGSLRHLGGAAKMIDRVRQGLAGLGFEAAIALARTPRAALWRAAGGGGRIEDLAVAVMGLDAGEADFLHGIGVRSIGDLRRLPRAGLAKRIAPRRLDELDQAAGVRPEPRVFFAPPAHFVARLELPGEVSEAQAVLFAARRLLVQLEGFLAARHAGVRRFVLALLHRRAARRDIAVDLAAPARDAGHFTILLRERLEAVSLADPVQAIRLEARDLAALAGRSASLFADAREGEEEWLRLIERLRARLGDRAVHGLAVHPEHRPEQAWCRVEPGARMVRVPDAFGPRPLWLLDPPRRVAEGGFTLLAGPERIESGWWDGREAARDYFIAQDRDSALVWIYRERRQAAGWYLHGIFA